MDIKYYDINALAQKFGIDRRKFHREIKPTIIADFKNELAEIENPDIGLDSNNDIYLKDTRSGKVIATNLNVTDYNDD